MSSEEGKPFVKQEAGNNKEILQAKNVIKNSYVLEFLYVKANTAFYERNMEQAIVDKL